MSILTEPVNANSPLALMMQHWIPPLITILVGGLFASIVFPRWQDAYTRARATSQQRLDLTLEIASVFARYIAAWRRLIDISRLAIERTLSEEERERRNGFVSARNAARDTLLDLLARERLLCSVTSCAEIEAFLEWDRKQTAKRLDELPAITEWRIWEARILGSLRDDLGQR